MSTYFVQFKWLASLLVSIPIAAFALVGADDSTVNNTFGNTFAGSGPAGVTTQQAGGANSAMGRSGAAPGGQQQGNQQANQQSGQQQGAGAQGGSKKPGGGIGSNIEQVNAILNPDKEKENQTKTAVTIPEPMANEDTRGIIMDQSINRYTERCACPYSLNSDGFECGVEAAYYKPGGFRIKCYPQDVRGQENIFYRKNH